MPKTSEIALKNEKRTDIFGINPIVSICIGTSIEIRFHFSMGSFILLQMVSNWYAR